MPTLSTLSFADHLTTSPPSVATQVVGEVVGLCFLAGIACCLTYVIMRFCKCCKKGMNDSIRSCSEEGTPKKAEEGDVEAPSVSFSGPPLSASCPLLLDAVKMEEIELNEGKNEEADKETGEYCKNEGSKAEMEYEKEDEKYTEGTDEDCKKEGCMDVTDEKKNEDTKEGMDENCNIEECTGQGVGEDCKNGGTENEEENEKADDRKDEVDCKNTEGRNEVENENDERNDDDYPEIEGYGIVDLEMLEDALREDPPEEEDDSDDPTENPFMEKKTGNYTPTHTTEYRSGLGNIVVTYNPSYPPLFAPAPLPVLQEAEEMEQREEAEANANDYVCISMEDLTDMPGETSGDGNVENVNQEEEKPQEEREERIVVRYNEQQFLLLDLDSSTSEVFDSDEENEVSETEEKESSDEDEEDKDKNADKEDKKGDEDKEDKKGDEDKEDKKGDEDKEDKKGDEDKEHKKRDEDKENEKEDEDKAVKQEDDKQEMTKDNEDNTESKDDKNEESEKKKAEEDKGKASEQEEGDEAQGTYNYIFLSCDEATDDELLEEGRGASSRPRRHSPVAAEALSDESDDSIYYSYREDDDDDEDDEEEAELFEWDDSTFTSPLHWPSPPSLHQLRAVMMAAQDPGLYRRAREAYVRAVSALGLTMPGQIVHPHLCLPQDLSHCTRSPREAVIAAARAGLIQDE